MQSLYEELCDWVVESRVGEKRWEAAIAEAPAILRTEVEKLLGLEPGSIAQLADGERRIVTTHYLPCTERSRDVLEPFTKKEFFGPEFKVVFAIGLLIQPRAGLPMLTGFQCCARAAKGEILYASWDPEAQSERGSFLTAEAFAGSLLVKLGEHLKADLMQGPRKKAAEL